MEKTRHRISGKIKGAGTQADRKENWRRKRGDERITCKEKY